MALVDRISQGFTAVRTKLNLMSSTIAGKANAVHAHTPDEITGLEEALTVLSGIEVSKYWGDPSSYYEWDENPGIRKVMFHSPANNVDLVPLFEGSSTLMVKFGTAVGDNFGPTPLVNQIRFGDGLQIEHSEDEETGASTATVVLDPSLISAVSNIPSDEELFGTQWNPDGDLEVSTVIYLNRDMWFTSVTMKSGGKINTTSHRMFVSNYLDVRQAGAKSITNTSSAPGSLNAVGTAGANPYPQTSSGPYPSDPNGYRPGDGLMSPFLRPTLTQGTYGSNGANVGAFPFGPQPSTHLILGGAGSGGGTGGWITSGPPGTPGGYVTVDSNPPYAYLVPYNPTYNAGRALLYGGQGGAGGGAGAGTNGGGGGAGGMGGPHVYVAARTIIFPASPPGGQPIITSVGGEGGNGANGGANSGGGAGGGGGGGGTVQLVTKYIVGPDYDEQSGDDPTNDDMQIGLACVEGMLASIGGQGGKGGNGTGTGLGGQGGTGGCGGYVVLRLAHPLADAFHDPIIIDANWTDPDAPSTPSQPTNATGSNGSAGQIVAFPNLFF